MDDSTVRSSVAAGRHPLADSLRRYLKDRRSVQTGEVPFAIGEWLETLADDEVQRLSYGAKQAVRGAECPDEIMDVATTALSAETRRAVSGRHLLQMPQALVVVALLEKKRRLGDVALDAPLRIDPASSFRVRLLGNAGHLTAARH
jgi:hypothetical protein